MIWQTYIIAHTPYKQHSRCVMVMGNLEKTQKKKKAMLWPREIYSLWFCGSLNEKYPQQAHYLNASSSSSVTFRGEEYDILLE